MQFHYKRTYRGKLQAAVFDWAGTTIDYGSQAPTHVFIDVFAEQGIDISLSEARAPMGMHKRDHIMAITQMPRVRALWQQVHGRAPDDNDVQTIFDAFIPQLVAVVSDYATLIPGVSATITSLRARGLKIGSCTGYTRQIMHAVVDSAATQGYAPDTIVCADEVRAGRPAPWMLLRNMALLGVYPPAAIVKIGDTIPDIEAGLNAGTWTIGIAQTGSEVGLSQDEIETLAPTEQHRLLQKAYGSLARAGAHYVVDSIRDVSTILDDIESKLTQGLQP